MLQTRLLISPASKILVMNYFICPEIRLPHLVTIDQTQDLPSEPTAKGKRFASPFHLQMFSGIFPGISVLVRLVIKTEPILS